MNRGYIEDGFSLSAFIAADQESKSGERLWESLDFQYRPATRSEMLRLDAEVRIVMLDEHSDPNCSTKADKLSCDFTAKHLLTWDLKDSKGQPVPRTGECVSRLHPELFNSLYRVIRGMQTGDPRPPENEPDPTDEEQLKN